MIFPPKLSEAILMQNYVIVLLRGAKYLVLFFCLKQMQFCATVYNKPQSFI